MIVEKAGSSDINKTAVNRVLDAMSDVINDEVLHNGCNIRIDNVGTFKQKINKPRKGRNPKTGEEIEIKGSTTISFRPTTSLRIKDS
jgi:DNA-binding protein HU-beta